MGWYPGKAVVEVYRAYQEGRSDRTESRNQRRAANTGARQKGRTKRQGARKQNQLARIEQGTDLAGAINRRIGGGAAVVPYDSGSQLPEWTLPAVLLAGLAFIGVILSRRK